MDGESMRRGTSIVLGVRGKVGCTGVWSGKRRGLHDGRDGRRRWEPQGQRRRFGWDRFDENRLGHGDREDSERGSGG